VKLGHSAITWGGVVGTAGGVGSIADLFYATHGDTVSAIRDIGAAGYSGTEIFDGDLLEFEHEPDRLLDALAAADIRLVSVYTGANFIFDDIADDEFAKISRAAGLAARFGADRLVLGGGAKRSGGPHADDIARLGRGLQRAAVLAADHGLQASYHPHLGTLVEAPDALARLMDLADIRFCPDTAHLAGGGGDPAALIREYGDRLAHVHLKDWDSASATFQPLGEGELDFADIIAALREAGYDDWLMVELDDFAGEPLDAARLSMSTLGRLLGADHG